jgi:hypothetical protein
MREKLANIVKAVQAGGDNKDNPRASPHIIVAVVMLAEELEAAWDRIEKLEAKLAGSAPTA